ncbi:MAG: class I SAM-dependent methyltransferase [Polyangiaceae bacterium]
MTSESSPPASVGYALASQTDRDRLFLQFDLYKDRFRDAFERLLAKAGHAADAPLRVLDVACGEGLYAADLVERHPAYSVVGFDKDVEAIATARVAFASHPRLTFHVADAQEPLGPVTGLPFDLAYAQFAVAHITNGGTALRNVFEVLRPGSYIMSCDPPENSIQYPHPACESLVQIFNRMWRNYGTFAAGDRQAELLSSAGFVDVTVEDQSYPVGGTSKVGRSNFVNLVEFFRFRKESLGGASKSRRPRGIRSVVCAVDRKQRCFTRRKNVVPRRHGAQTGLERQSVRTPSRKRRNRSEPSARGASTGRRLAVI